MIIISNVLLSIGFMGLAFIDSFWQFLILYGIVAALGMGGTTVPPVCGLDDQMVRKKARLRRELGTCRQLYGTVCFGTGVYDFCFAIWLAGFVFFYQSGDVGDHYIAYPFYH